MHVINATTISEALAKGLRDINILGITRDSRNGRVREFPTPVATQYLQPWNRLLNDRARNANPFLHLFESLWILEGRNDVKFLEYFTPRFRDFSDDGITLHGAYGERLRGHFHMDQIQTALRMLSKDPDSRRVVLQIWDANVDLDHKGRDLPCNDMIALKVREDHLFMTVFNRSNDLIWGCYGANAVHFSMLHQYLAEALGYRMGPYVQVSDSLHAYLEGPPGKAYARTKDGFVFASDPYRATVLNQSATMPLSLPLIAVGESRYEFDEDLHTFFDEVDDEHGLETIDWMNLPFTTSFFKNIVSPAMEAWVHYKVRGTATVESGDETYDRSDWTFVMNTWLKWHSQEEG